MFDPSPSPSTFAESNRYLHQIAPTPLAPVCIEDGPPIWCKLEFLNPSGSTKDRIARHILEKAWRQRKITAGSTVAEASSGSTSIAFALACSQMGLRFVAFIPESATSERELIIRAYGGEVRRVLGSMRDVLVAAAETSELERVANELGESARVVTVFPDRMERYFSHKVFEQVRHAGA